MSVGAAPLMSCPAPAQPPAVWGLGTALICGSWTRSSRHHMAAGGSQIGPLPSPALFYPWQCQEGSSAPWRCLPDPVQLQHWEVEASPMAWKGFGANLPQKVCLGTSLTFQSNVDSSLALLEVNPAHQVKYPYILHQERDLCTKPTISALLWLQPMGRPPISCPGWQQLPRSRLGWSTAGLRAKCCKGVWFQ